jgi:hypothetical protein
MPRQHSSDLFPTYQPIPASQMIGHGMNVREIASTLVDESSVILAGGAPYGQDERMQHRARRARERGYAAIIESRSRGRLECSLYSRADRSRVILRHQPPDATHAKQQC